MMSPSGASRMLRLLGVLKEALSSVGSPPITLQQVRVLQDLTAAMCVRALTRLSVQENAKAFERTRTLYQALGMSPQAMLQALEQSSWRFSPQELSALLEVRLCEPRQVLGGGARILRLLLDCRCAAIGARSLQTCGSSLAGLQRRMAVTDSR